MNISKLFYKGNTIILCTIMVGIYQPFGYADCKTPEEHCFCLEDDNKAVLINCHKKSDNEVECCTQDKPISCDKNDNESYNCVDQEYNKMACRIDCGIKQPSTQPARNFDKRK